MFKKILVPLDGSNTSEIVLPYVAEIAVKTNSSILLISVREPDKENMESICKENLERFAEKLRSAMIKFDSRETSIIIEVLSGNPANDIVDFAEINEVDLVVLSSHGVSGYGPWPLGAVTSKVISTINSPTLLIKVPIDEPTIERKQLFEKILVPLDGSELGGAALPIVEFFGAVLNSEITLFQSVRHMEHSPSLQEMKEWRAPSMAYLKGIAHSFKQKGLKVNTLVLDGPPVNSIVEYTKRNKVDLIAMSSHGSSGIMRWVFGSVTEKILHAGDTPVLVVKCKKV